MVMVKKVQAKMSSFRKLGSVLCILTCLLGVPAFVIPHHGSRTTTSNTRDGQKLFCETFSSTRSRKTKSKINGGSSELDNNHFRSPQPSSSIITVTQAVASVDKSSSKAAVGKGAGKRATPKSGGDIESLLSKGLAAAEESKTSVEELEDFLIRITRVLPEKYGSWKSVGKDPRLKALLMRIQEAVPSMPPRLAPFLLNALSKLPPSSLPPNLLEVIHGRVDVGLDEGLPPIALCTVAYSYSRLSYSPKGGSDWWIHRFLDCTQNTLINFSPWQISQLIRSLTVQPKLSKEDLLPPSFLTLALKCAERRINSFTARDLEAMATTMSKISHYKPDKSFLEQLTNAAYQVLPSFPIHSLSRFLHALSRLDFQPRPEILQGFEAACLNTSSQWGQNELALVMQAWSWLRFQPSEKTMTALLDQARSLLNNRQFSPLNLGTLVVGLGELRRCPPEEWMLCFQQASLERLSEMGGKDLNYLLKGLSKLGWYPGDDFIFTLLTQMQPLLKNFNGPDLQFSITALVGLNYKPPGVFIQAFKQRVLDCLPSMASRDASIIMWSFAALDIPDSQDFFSLLMTAAAGQLRKDKSTWSRDLPLSERWPSVARLRQLRQVYLHAQTTPELVRLIEELNDLQIPQLIQEGLELIGDDGMVLKKAIESSFHQEVAEVVHHMGATTRRAVDIFLLDILIEAPPSAAPVAGEGRGERLPIVLLLHGPSRFLRYKYTRLEAGTSFKVRILNSQTHRFAKVVSISYTEWGQVRSREEKIDLLKEKVGPIIEDYLL